MTVVLNGVDSARAAPSDRVDGAWRGGLLSRFTEESQRVLRQAGHLAEFERGTAVTLHDVVLVIDGLASVRRRVDDRGLALRHIGPGELSGVGAILGGLPLTLHPLTHVTAYVVPGELFVAEVRRSPQNTLATARDVSGANSQVLTELADHVFLPMPGRIARHLLERLGRVRPGGPLAVPTTTAEIAAAIGTVPAVVGRALAALEADGLVERRTSRILILDPVRLNEQHASAL